MRPQVELLAPAGSVESMVAAINAGADAIYMGGSRYGARAYADNPQEDGFLQAIDYAHLHGCRLYMTVNTLVKDEELDMLSDFLMPYYRQGLDAAIVQDLGVLTWIREYFPDLAVHVSTQATVTGYRSAKLFQEFGATRIVTARELSLREIARIRDETDIEIESFVHGALCYCYSGQCLLSSLIGGRSGNRGRCAQPCRLPYAVDVSGSGGRTGNGRTGSGSHPAGKRQGRGAESAGRSRTDGGYLLNLKDLCTLDLLPDILEAGVYSLKIEGRMKSPRYTAGVVSIYRKYVDYYLKNGRDGYRVDPADKRMLLDLFDRGGFTQGYYRQHNGREMISLQEKPGFREGNQELLDSLDQRYVNKKRQEPVEGMLRVREGEALSLTLMAVCSGGKAKKAAAQETAPPASGPDDAGDGTIVVRVTGSVAQTAQNQPVTEERLRRQIQKTGETPFYFRQLSVELSGNCFVPVQELNDLRRCGLEKLEEGILEKYRRLGVPGKGRDNGKSAADDRNAVREEAGGVSSSVLRLHVSLEEPEGLAVAAAHPDVDEIYLDACGFPAEDWQGAVEACHRAGKQCALILPHIFREKAEQYFVTHRQELTQAGFDELMIRSLEELVFLREQGVALPLVTDANLYGMNRQACVAMTAMGAARLTLPLELNRQELERLGCGGRELVGYGHLPAMVSAQCVRQTAVGCTERPEILWMRDRTGKRLPVKNHCWFCYNTIYNPDPLSLLGLGEQVRKLEPAVLRISFTIEEPRRIQEVLDAYGDHFRRGKESPAPSGAFTRGHFKRGVE